jgi:hypothetical protein
VVTVRLTPEDHSSRWYAGADNLVRFTVTGSGTIAGVERQLAAMSDMV